MLIRLQVDEIAKVDGIDVLLIGVSIISAEY